MLLDERRFDSSVSIAFGAAHSARHPVPVPIPVTPGSGSIPVHYIHPRLGE